MRHVVEPSAGTTRRIPFGLAAGLRFSAEPAATASADMWVGLFESEVAAYVRRFCRLGLTTVDVGANSGYYTLTLARLSQATVVAYEPDPDARQRLIQNLRLNPQVAPYVDLRTFAVADRDTADSVTLDADLAEGPPVGLLKVDVDGGELGVLNGARSLLAEQRPNVIVETHSLELEDACAHLLISAGYRPRIVTPRRILPQNRPARHNRWLIAAARTVR